MCMNETETREDKMGVGVGVGGGKSGLSDGRNNVILYSLILFEFEKRQKKFFRL